jgi:hypothetical protein
MPYTNIRCLKTVNSRFVCVNEMPWFGKAWSEFGTDGFVVHAHSFGIVQSTFCVECEMLR